MDNILQGEKVRLTAVTKDDLPAIARWYEDAAFGRLSDAAPAMPRSAEQWAKWLEEQQGDKNVFLFGIRPVNGNELLGYADINGILWTHGNGWIGIGLGDRGSWGKGYGREAMALILKFAFDELNLHRVQLTVFSYNERAIALYEKLGFTREGVYREHLLRDGRRYDMLLYGLLHREWAGHPPGIDTSDPGNNPN
ncbi:MAG: GNAT family N-acetyltransferase [Chloroflexi bacterium]|nr:GNAT family N-acetyltransferase [Chloroflexota bacterium]MCI0580607.1 GNAT family N-acetyltransferase [Chloroflexota bacterium]MCI0648871.1 GNAT family N-acetyltransferase [Chloroflexota bacterium]MCI0728201.1 GNAT family N-acetyltransferase [Chloroflexota bacterium]